MADVVNEILVEDIKYPWTALSRPQVDACVLAFLRNRGNWNTQTHTGRIVVDYAAHSKNIRVSEHLGGALGRQRIHVHVTGDETQ